MIPAYTFFFSISELFVPFSEVNKSTLNGTGLGLFSVASHVHRLGGRYGYKPNLEKGGTEQNPHGSIFWFQLPICKVDSSNTPLGMLNVSTSKNSVDSLSSNMSDHLPAKDSMSSFESSKLSSSTPTPTPNSSGGKSSARVRTSLVIDDSITVRKPLAKTIMSQGFQCDVAKNGLEGLEKMKIKKYDFVFLDFLMPVMDGIDCIKQLRLWESQKRPDFSQCIIGISANASLHEQELVEGEKVGRRAKRAEEDA